MPNRPFFTSLAVLVVITSASTDTALGAQKQTSRQELGNNSKGGATQDQETRSGFVPGIKGESGMLYGKGYAYMLAAPEGWLLDVQSASEQGVDAVLYRRGQKWPAAEPQMYTNAAAKVRGERDTLEKRIPYDLSQMKQRDPQLKVVPAEPMQTGDGRRAVAYDLTFAKVGTYQERIAYIDTPKAVVRIAITARTRSAYDQAMPDFVSLVRSFTFVTDEVVFAQPKPERPKGRVKKR